MVPLIQRATFLVQCTITFAGNEHYCMFDIARFGHRYLAMQCLAAMLQRTLHSLSALVTATHDVASRSKWIKIVARSMLHGLDTHSYLAMQYLAAMLHKTLHHLAVLAAATHFIASRLKGVKVVPRSMLQHLTGTI